MQENCYWEADSGSVGHEISYLLLNLKVHYRIQSSQPQDSILCHPNAVYNLTPHLFTIKHNIIPVFKPKNLIRFFLSDFRLNR